MANHLGREGLVKISSTTIGELRNYALSHSSDTVEDSVIGDTYRTRLATMKTWSASGDLYWDEADAGQLLITIGSQVTLNLYPEGASHDRADWDRGEKLRREDAGPGGGQRRPDTGAGVSDGFAVETEVAPRMLRWIVNENQMSLVFTECAGALARPR